MTEVAKIEVEKARQLLKANHVAESIALYQKLVDENSEYKGGAAYSLGLIYRNPPGVPKDDQKAEKYFEIAEQRGYSLASYYLGGILRRRREWSKALEKYAKIAESNPSAAYWAYRILSENQEFDPEGEKAKYYFDLAVKQGHLYALKTDAIERLSNKRGIMQMPGGLIDFVLLSIYIVKASVKDDRLKYM